MNTFAAIALFAVLQDKPTVAPEPPTDTAWPIQGRMNRPDGTVIKISAARVERRWDPVASRFRELVSRETRLARSAEVDGRGFKANLKPGPVGIYDVSLQEGGKRIHGERHLLGGSAALFASTRKSVAKMVEIGERASACLDDLQRILAGKQPGTAQARETFIKRVAADEELLQDLAAKTDLTASIALLNDICVQIRNAQVWELPAGTVDEQLNDGKVGERDIFLDPQLTFTSLRAMIASVKTVVSRELSLSAASMLDAAFARAEEKGERFLSRAKNVATEALKLLALAPEEDKEARAAVEAAERADTPGIPDVRKGLRAVAAQHLGAP